MIMKTLTHQYLEHIPLVGSNGFVDEECNRLYFHLNRFLCSESFPNYFHVVGTQKRVRGMAKGNPLNNEIT